MKAYNNFLNTEEKPTNRRVRFLHVSLPTLFRGIEIYCGKQIKQKGAILDNALRYVDTVESFIKPWIDSSVKLVDLMKVIANINSTLDIGELLALIMESAKSVMQSEASSLMMLDKNTGELIISIPTGPVKAKLSDLRIPRGKGIAGWVATHGEPLIVPDVSVDPRFYEEADRASGFKTKSILCVPMRNMNGEIIGVLEAINRHSKIPFSKLDISLLSELADQAAIAIENARLYEESVRELKEAKDALDRHNRLATLGQIMGNLCHELRSPLTTISGASYFLKNTLTEAEGKTQQYLSMIDNSISIAEKIVKDLLDFAKIRPLERQVIQISELLENVLERLTVPENVKIEQDILPDLPEVFADAMQVGQVFTNIITNAIDAMLEGGTLTIHAEEKEQSIRVFFTDTGCGIPAENLPKVFEPLFSTKERGIGFGLAVAKNLTEANNGSIYVESEVGYETTFTVILPTKTA